jgi:hypothetical protein
MASWKSGSTLVEVEEIVLPSRKRTFAYSIGGFPRSTHFCPTNRRIACAGIHEAGVDENDSNCRRTGYSQVDPLFLFFATVIQIAVQ